MIARTGRARSRAWPSPRRRLPAGSTGSRDCPRGGPGTGTGRLLSFKKGGFNLALELGSFARTRGDQGHPHRQGDAIGQNARTSASTTTCHFNASEYAKAGLKEGARSAHQAPKRSRAGLARVRGSRSLVNANAKRGGRPALWFRLRARCRGGAVRLTKTIDEIAVWLPSPNPARILAAGGGRTLAIALINALARVIPPASRPSAYCPLGTGNAWAHAQLGRAEARRGTSSAGQPPWFSSCFATTACSTTTGVTSLRRLGPDCGHPRRVQEAARGLARAPRACTGTSPRRLSHGAEDDYPRMSPRPQSRVGDDVFTMTADRKLLKLAGVKRRRALRRAGERRGGQHLPPVRLRLSRVPVRRATPGDDQRAHLRPSRAGRDRQHPEAMARRASPAWNARLVGHQRANDVLAPGAGTDRRRCRRNAAMNRPPLRRTNVAMLALVLNGSRRLLARGRSRADFV